MMREQWALQARQAEEKRAALEQSFLAGEDCRWTPVNGSADVYCRVNRPG